MSWWRRPKVDHRDILIDVLRQDIAILSSMHRRDVERIDRLMESMASRAGFNLVMPLPEPAPPLPKEYIPNPWKDPNLITPIKEN